MTPRRSAEGPEAGICGPARASGVVEVLVEPSLQVVRLRRVGASGVRGGANGLGSIGVSEGGEGRAVENQGSVQVPDQGFQSFGREHLAAEPLNVSLDLAQGA